MKSSKFSLYIRSHTAKGANTLILLKNTKVLFARVQKEHTTLNILTQSCAFLWLDIFLALTRRGWI